MPAETVPETAEQAAARAPAATRTQQPLLTYEQITDEVQKRRQWVTDVLPGTVDTDRWIGLALYAISRQPKLRRCTLESLVRGLRESASLGLEIGSSMGQATLLPFWNSKLRSYEAVFIPMYQGLLELAYRTGEVADAEARVVYDCDEFDWIPAADQPIRHRPALERPPTAKRKGAYFLAHLRNGGRVSEWMNAVEIEDIRKRARAADDGPWVTDPDAMWRKTVTRRAMKYMPKSVELRTALAVEEDAERTYAVPPAPARRVGGPDARAQVLDMLAQGNGEAEEATASPDGQHGAEEPQTAPDTDQSAEPAEQPEAPAQAADAQEPADADSDPQD